MSLLSFVWLSHRAFDEPCSYLVVCDMQEDEVNIRIDAPLSGG